MFGKYSKGTLLQFYRVSDLESASQAEKLTMNFLVNDKTLHFESLHFLRLIKVILLGKSNLEMV